MQMSARGAQKKRDESKKLVMYSKQWVPGDTLRVFYPIYWEDGRPEIAVGAVWGHSVSDIKALGLHTAFIPSTTDFDENRLPIGQPDITYQFSKIARVFVNGMKKEEEERIESKKGWQSDAAKKAALRSVEDKYDSKNNQNAVRPIISPLQYYISTEVVSVKIANKSPVMDTVKVSSAPLSSQTITRLYAIMEDPKYAPQVGDKFFEVEWKYPSDPDKGMSSRSAAPAGLTPEYRFQAQWEDKYAAVQSQCGGIMFDSESIKRRATKSVDPMKVMQAIMQYTFINSQYLDYADGEDVDLLCRNIELLDRIGVMGALENKSLLSKLKEELQKYKDNREAETSSMLPNPLEASAEVPENVAKEVEQTMGELPDPNPQAPTIESLLNHPMDDANNIVPDDILDSIDLASIA